MFTHDGDPPAPANTCLSTLWERKSELKRSHRGWRMAMLVIPSTCWNRGSVKLKKKKNHGRYFGVSGTVGKPAHFQSQLQSHLFTSRDAQLTFQLLLRKPPYSLVPAPLLSGPPKHIRLLLIETISNLQLKVALCIGLHEIDHFPAESYHTSPGHK